MRSNSELIEHLIANRVLKTKEIIDAFYAIDRINFVVDKFKAQAYEDHPLGIGYGQTISQPFTVAFMLEILNPTRGDKVLDIGTGSGWTTALLSYIVGDDGKVTGVERIKELVEFGNSNLKKYSITNAKINLATEELGVKGAKFDKILVSASANELPKELIKQLKINASLVIPVQSSIVHIVRVTENEFYKKEYYGFAFVPLIY